MVRSTVPELSSAQKISPQNSQLTTLPKKRPLPKKQKELIEREGSSTKKIVMACPNEKGVVKRCDEKEASHMNKSYNKLLAFNRLLLDEGNGVANRFNALCGGAIAGNEGGEDAPYNFFRVFVFLVLLG